MRYFEKLRESWQKKLKEKLANAPTVVSLFAGCGGSSLGYSIAGFRELLAVDFDKNAVEVFRINFPNVPIMLADITKLSGQEILDKSGLIPGELDVLDGSPPCQGFSTAGKRDFADEKNDLFGHYIRILQELRPKVFIAENVSGMVKGKMKLIFAGVLRELKDSGYNVRASLLNAKFFNVPSNRERLIFIGVRNDLKILPSFPLQVGAIILPADAWENLLANDELPKIVPDDLKQALKYYEPGKLCTEKQKNILKRITGKSGG